MDRARLAICATIWLVALGGTALAANSGARPATRSERAGVLHAFAINDGSPSQVSAVYVSRSDSSLAVACVRSPDAGTQGYVFRRSRHSWRYVTSGKAGHAGNASERRLETACG